MTLLTAIALLAALLVGLPAAPRRRLARLEERVAGTVRPVPWTMVAGPLAVAGLTLAGLLVAGGQGAAIGFCLGLILLTGWVVWRDHRARTRSRRRSEQVVAGCLALAGLLRVGHVPAVALRLAADDSPALVEAAAVQQVGGDVPAALRRMGSAAGGAGLGELALSWEVSVRTGASLTATLDALVVRLDAARALRRVVDAELSAPRATSRLLAALPVAGLGLGFAFGGDPLAFLLGTGPGRAALCLGVALACAGVLWTEAIARRAGG